MRQFFKVPQRLHNATMILNYLDGKKNRTPVSINEISGKLLLSGKYLEQIAGKLKQAGIIKSWRGASGGYLLKKSLKEISLLQVMEALEGKMSLVGCVGGGCDFKKSCPSVKVWQRTQKELIKTLKNVKLK